MATKKITKPQETPLVTDFVEEAIAEAKTINGVANTKVNVRAKASLDSKIVKVLDEGQEIEIKSEDLIDGFYRVSGGYVKAEYLNIKEA